MSGRSMSAVVSLAAHPDLVAVESQAFDLMAFWSTTATATTRPKSFRLEIRRTAASPRATLAKMQLF